MFMQNNIWLIGLQQQVFPVQRNFSFSPFYHGDQHYAQIMTTTKDLYKEKHIASGKVVNQGRQLLYEVAWDDTK